MEKVLRDTIAAMDIRIENLEADKKNLQNELSAAVTRNNKLEEMITGLMDSFNSLDSAEEMTIEEILNREG